ncbi:hypothetical protein [Lutispora thermophila]|uniref:Uncharacterized protein n=1 Tax=Lutispora thermophila DSM 19022 TaxID=1122184 RepID=A0A1M6FL23_9FIRM|nr:hypothetical protein [Lutispora thermophila]SHI98322.1 hypothetical protein SAMN02745176_02022 [Lutispora thermophila DSM 19022]
MYQDSKIISFVIGFEDMMAKAGRHSFFCKLIKNFVGFIRNSWRDSFFGQIVDSMFNIEAHRNSTAYKVTSRSIMASLGFISRILSLEQGISESKYFALINYSRPRENKIEEDENRVRAILKDSFIIRHIYEFWNNVD